MIESHTHYFCSRTTYDRIAFCGIEDSKSIGPETTTTVPTLASCDDQDVMCSGWATDGYCVGIFSEFMSINCAASCVTSGWLKFHIILCYVCILNQ